MNSFNIIALDKDFNIVSLLRYTNLQWRRKYHEPGSFSVEIPIDQYRTDIRYIYTKDRPEVGEVSQVNYLTNQGYKRVSMSGYFLEAELNWRVVYKKGTSSNINGTTPSWTIKRGAAETVALYFFNGFANISFVNHDYSSGYDVQTQVHSPIGIDVGEDLQRGLTAEHTRNNERLGDKIYGILKPSGMSYRIVYDFSTNKKKFECWSGVNRTEENEEGNNPIVFSTRYGNVKDVNILISNTSVANCIIQDRSSNEDGSENVLVKASRAGGREQAGYEDITSDRFIAQSITLNEADYASEAEFQRAVEAEARYKLKDYEKTINLEFDAMAGSYTYGVDFNLGDMCSIEVPDIGLSADARLIACYEVIKGGQWIMSMEFGTPMIKG